jgi:hypothetical protein
MAHRPRHPCVFPVACANAGRRMYHMSAFSRSSITGMQQWHSISMTVTANQPSTRTMAKRSSHMTARSSRTSKTAGSALNRGRAWPSCCTAQSGRRMAPVCCSVRARSAVPASRALRRRRSPPPKHRFAVKRLARKPTMPLLRRQWSDASAEMIFGTEKPQIKLFGSRR